MRAVVQRVSCAQVWVEDQVVGHIGAGLLVYVGIGVEDTAQDAQYLAGKVARLRVFNDPHDKMNLDVKQINGSCLVVSAFTTMGDARKGNRPEFTSAAQPELANQLYELFCEQLRGEGINVQTGQFRAKMTVESHNDGPICVLLDSQKAF